MYIQYHNLSKSPFFLVKSPFFLYFSICSLTKKTPTTRGSLQRYPVPRHPHLLLAPAGWLVPVDPHPPGLRSTVRWSS